METIHVIGAGPAGMMAAQQFALKGHPVIVYDHKSAAGRKFLVAGNGGFNLTHSEDIELFLTRYNSAAIQTMVREFTSQDTVHWLQSIGIPTYIGSSGKVFPEKGIKPIEVLQKWLGVLSKLNVQFKFGYRLTDFNLEKLIFTTKGQTVDVFYKRAVFAFGGKSWSITGSDGSWVSLFESKGIKIKLLEPSNSGLEMEIPFIHLAGKPLKNIRLFNENGEKNGELIFTDYGIEGSAVYFMNRYIRQNAFPQQLYLDLKPQLSLQQIQQALLSTKTGESLKNKLKLEWIKIALLKTLDKESYTNHDILAERIKKFPVSVKGFRPIDEVISSFGGLEWEGLDERLFLKKYPTIQCCGEMLDWDAPTGGYLLQACFASGYYAGNM